VAWYRKGDKVNDGLVAVICNGTEEGKKRIDIGTEHKGSKWTDVLGWHQAEVVVGDDGFADFFSPARSVSVWTKVDAKGRDEFGRGA
jgi:alpha-amylase